ncbi:MAG: hypothetical protein CVT92_02100 [Bacteroidetes bacterium HGW-Bacteroidetes-1]|nr:MAG: hypothetical protein CVT92_02100 [Bacteroidetes bacterium HGW-Bacteroidetes-1]
MGKGINQMHILNIDVEELLKQGIIVEDPNNDLAWEDRIPVKFFQERVCEVSGTDIRVPYLHKLKIRRKYDLDKPLSALPQDRKKPIIDEIIKIFDEYYRIDYILETRQKLFDGYVSNYISYYIYGVK